MPVNPDTVTHVAGPWVQVNGRCVQRCMVCGDKLADLDSLGPPPDKGRPDGVWAMGSLVKVEEGRQGSVGDFESCKQLPDDFCMALVEKG